MGPQKITAKGSEVSLLLQKHLRHQREQKVIVENVRCVKGMVRSRQAKLIFWAFPGFVWKSARKNNGTRYKMYTNFCSLCLSLVYLTVHSLAITQTAITL